MGKLDAANKPGMVLDAAIDYVRGSIELQVAFSEAMQKSRALQATDSKHDKKVKKSTYSEGFRDSLECIEARLQLVLDATPDDDAFKMHYSRLHSFYDKRPSRGVAASSRPP